MLLSFNNSCSILIHMNLPHICSHIFCPLISSRCCREVQLPKNRSCCLCNVSFVVDWYVCVCVYDLCCVHRILNCHTEIHSGLRKTFHFRRHVKAAFLIHTVSIQLQKMTSRASSVGRLPPTVSATLATSRWRWLLHRHIFTEARTESKRKSRKCLAETLTAKSTSSKSRCIRSVPRTCCIFNSYLLGGILYRWSCWTYTYVRRLLRLCETVVVEHLYPVITIPADM